MNDVSTRRRGADSNRMSAEQILEMLQLLKGSNSVELKIIVPDSLRGSLRRLGFDPVEAEPRQAYFFDTPDLALNKAGLIVRARRSPGDRGDTVVKLRPIDPARLDRELRRDAGFKIEIDVQPGGFVCSGSAKGRCTAEEAYEASEGRIRLESIFSRQQVEFYKAHAPAGVSMDDLVALGPVLLLRIKQQPQDFDRPMIVEIWLYPDGSRILELSTKGTPEEAVQLALDFRRFLADCGIPLERGTITKTSSALAYFSKHAGPKAGDRARPDSDSSGASPAA